MITAAHGQIAALQKILNRAGDDIARAQGARERALIRAGDDEGERYNLCDLIGSEIDQLNQKREPDSAGVKFSCLTR